MAENSPEKESQSREEDLLHTARERFKLAAEAEEPIRKKHLEDLKFRAGEQWPAEVLKEREQDQRPCLTINRIHQFVNQVTNDQRQNRTSIAVHPVDDKADIETAKIYRGLVRNIEYSSDAETAYDTAFDCAVTSGLGYFRILTEYCDPMSFDQEIKIVRIKNPLTVYCDPTYQNADGSDMEFAFIVDDLTPEEYKRLYPDSEMASMTEFSSIGDNAERWMPSGHIRVAEYMYKDYKETEIVLFSDGSIHPKEDIKSKKVLIPEGVVPVKTRKTMVPTVKWAKINAVEVLEERDLLGYFIPVIPVLGQELNVDGERILEGVVRHAKDSQRSLNYFKSSQTETIALAPRAPFIGYEGQFQGYEAQWKTAHRRNHAFLQVKPVTIGGQPAPFPQRQVYEPPVQAIALATGEAAEDLKATTGIYDAALGARSNETSGKAINARNAQAQTSNFHFQDNLRRSIRHAGRIIVSWIPFVYDTPRTARIIGEDEQPQVVRINQFFEEGRQQKIYRLGQGKYDVVVSNGPPYATKRMEASETTMELARVIPQVGQVAPDLIAQNLDFHGAQEIAERLRKTLPPGIVEDKEKKSIPPEIQAGLMQRDQAIEALTKALNDAQNKLDQKTIELESKERIAFAEMENKAAIELAKLESGEARLILESQLAQVNNRQRYLNEDQPVGGYESQQFSAGPDGSAQPAGGFSPGNPMEGNP